MSKAQRKRETASKQQVANQTTSSFSLVNHSDLNHEEGGQLDNSFNRQDSGNNLLDQSAVSNVDNQMMHDPAADHNSTLKAQQEDPYVLNINNDDTLLLGNKDQAALH